MRSIRGYKTTKWRSYFGAAPNTLTELDQATGDGDLGISLERGSRAVQEELDGYVLDDPAATMRDLAVTLQHFGKHSAGFIVFKAARIGDGKNGDAHGLERIAFVNSHGRYPYGPELGE